jgi:release factor glutamine methyltransferase
LCEADITSPRAEAEWLLAGVLDAARTELYLREELVPEQAVEEVWAAAQRRVEGEPLQYIVGFTEFCGHRLVVSPAVLIPRPETEVLVEEAIRFLRQRPAGSPSSILEVGSGSGNVAISLAAAVGACPHTNCRRDQLEYVGVGACRIVGIELSWEALCVARANAQRCGVADRIRWVQADWTCGVSGPFDLVISNPPYVPTEEVRRLQGSSDVGHEPWVSLDGGADGMAFHRRLLAEAPRLLRDGGVLCMECAESHAESLARQAQHESWVQEARVFNDLMNRPRGLWVQRV